MTERVVRERPDVALVSKLERFFRGRIGEGPVKDRAFGSARDEDVGVDRVPGERCGNEGEDASALPSDLS